jgi:hypothetical protein
MKANYEQLKKDLLFEQEQLDLVIAKIRGIKDLKITEINTAATATYLMNFYNGIENIMKRCAREYYKKIPKGDDWHKQLLLQSSLLHKGKIPLFEQETVDKLYHYLTFRHFFVHGYGFKLNWEKMESLVENIDELWGDIKKQLSMFISKA